MNPVITGIGVVAPNGIGKEEFWRNLEAGKNGIEPITGFSTRKLPVKIAGEVKGYDPEKVLGPKGLRNLDRSALLLMGAAKQAIDEARLVINEKNADNIGIATGTTFSHLWPIAVFDKEVFKEGIDFANPALFPSTVINAASSQVSIRFNIRGFNATLSTGYTSSLEALKCGLNALSNRQIKTLLAGSVDTLSYPVLFGFHHLGYLAGLKGVAVSCPYDRRRNGPLLGEAATMLVIEDQEEAMKNRRKPLARVKSVASYFDAHSIARIHSHGKGLEKAIRIALDKAKIVPEDIDYIAGCANSSVDLDRIEVSALKTVFERRLKNIPVGSIKSMTGETFSASGALQIIAAAGAIDRGILPPTINFEVKDDSCIVDCVPNRSRPMRIKHALITSFGPGGYNSACVLEKA
jgi:3-oxoacyl-[acyl-carrier-protein] synthase II